MNISVVDTIILSTAACAILLLGSTHLRLNIMFFSLQTIMLAAVTYFYASLHREVHLVFIAGILFCAKAILIPVFFFWIIRRVGIHRDAGTLLPAPLSMHLGLAFLGISYILSRQLPQAVPGESSWTGATAAISLVCSGLLVMLTRRIALSQIVGFLIMENGIFLFGLTQARGMPLLVEMGILLDVLTGVMVSGLLAFKIQKSFEHIDVSQLSELKE